AAHPHPAAERPQAARREAVAARQPDIVRLEGLHDPPHPLPILRIALVEDAVPLENAPVGRAVDVVDRPLERRQPAGDERLTESFGREREVARDAETAEALPEHAPALDPELVPDQLRVPDDRVGPEV